RRAQGREKETMFVLSCSSNAGSLDGRRTHRAGSKTSRVVRAAGYKESVGGPKVFARWCNLIFVHAARGRLKGLSRLDGSDMDCPRVSCKAKTSLVTVRLTLVTNETKFVP